MNSSSNINIQIRKFAGREIEIKSTILSTQGETYEIQKQRTQSQKGLEKVLNDIKGPKTVSTVTKSSMDWETYKEEEGLNHELAQRSKDGEGYLGMKDFLNRVDVRRFEKEQEQRRIQRAKHK